MKFCLFVCSKKFKNVKLFHSQQGAVLYGREIADISNIFVVRNVTIARLGIETLNLKFHFFHGIKQKVQ